MAQIAYWSTVEVNASIICACIMTLKPLIQKWFPNMLSGSQHVHDRSLRWITPLNSTRESRHSFIRPTLSHQRATSGSGHRRSEALPRLEETETDVCKDELQTPDLEAQRSGSVSTVVGDDDSSIVGMSALRAPPKAHLRLSIHVTKSVHVTKQPESPLPGQCHDEKEAGFEGSQCESESGQQGHGDNTPGWQSDRSTIIVCKDWASDAGSNAR